MKLKRGVTVAAAAAACLFGSVGTAQALSYAPSSVDPGSYAVASGWLWVAACDGQVDGNRVRAWYRTATGDYPSPYWAPSGGCSDWHTPSGGRAITEIRACTENEGCGLWYPNNGTS